jgi:hypothetical protein
MNTFIRFNKIVFEFEFEFVYFRFYFAPPGLCQKSDKFHFLGEGSTQKWSSLIHVFLDASNSIGIGPNSNSNSNLFIAPYKTYYIGKNLQ